jgi:hypothetical protein
MDAHFDNAPRCSAAGVTTGAVLIVSLAMAASTLFTHEPAAPSASNSAGVTHTARAYHADSAKKS